MRNLLAILAFAASSPALAQQMPCGPAVPLNKMQVEKFMDKFQEQPSVVGVLNSGAKFVMLANRETGTFTLLSVLPDGTSCMFLSGDGAAFIPPKPRGKDM